MQIERTKNASRNIAFGITLKLYQIICPFIIRTTMIYILGMKFVGLNGLFNAILQVLNLTELGVGTAMVFSMYKPVADDDKDKICKLMQLYKTYYTIIGFIIATVGLLITPVIPKLISHNSNISLNIYYLYWMNLGYTVLSYWLFAYKNSILAAHQRTDVVSKVTLITNTIMYIIQLILLVVFKNYYLYLLALLLGQALNNLTIAVVADRMYPEFKARGQLEKFEIKEINQRVKDLFTAKVGGVIQNSTDSIIISMFLGLTLLAKYNNYYYILNSVFGFIVIIFNSSLAGVGNSLVMESTEKNYNDFKKIAFITEWIVGFCACSLLCLYQPFMKIWVGTSNLLSIRVVICLVLYFYIITINQMLCLYKDASGIWYKDRFRPLITAIVNLALNLLTVNYLGIYGVVLSTVFSMLFVGIPWLISNLFKSVFHRSYGDFVYKMSFSAAISIIVSTVTYFICSNINDNGIISIILKGIICLFIPNIIFLIAFHRLDEFRSSIKLVNNVLGNRINKIPLINKYL